MLKKRCSHEAEAVAVLERILRAIGSSALPSPSKAKAALIRESVERATAAYIKAGGKMDDSDGETDGGDGDTMIYGLSSRAMWACTRLGVTTFAELAKHTEYDVVNQRNVGQTTLDELRRALSKFGLKFSRRQS